MEASHQTFRDVLRDALNDPEHIEPECNSPVWRVIGRGTCGTVFATRNREANDSAFKKGVDEESLRRDHQFTQEVFKQSIGSIKLLQDAFPEYMLPRVPFSSSCSFLEKDEVKSRLRDTEELPEEEHTHGVGFYLQRILPLPEKVRHALIEEFFDEEDQEDAYKDEENQDCLIRIYLGKDYDGRPYNSLRNFELHLDQMLDFGLDVQRFATEIAVSLAIVHWAAQLDGMDIEFVLGSRGAWPTTHIEDIFKRSAATPAHSDNDLAATLPSEFWKNNDRPIHLWLLDFDKCTRITPTAHSVRNQLLPAVTSNDPYFPRPGQPEPHKQELWRCFSEAYLRASEVVLRGRGAGREERELPGLLVREWVEWVKRDEEWLRGVEGNVVFED